MTIAGIFQTSLGHMAIAATARGVCYLALGSDAAALERDLRAALPQARTTSDTTADTAPDTAPHDRLRVWASEIEHRLKGAVPISHPPLDLSGTPFQQRVWAELRRIPRGARCSYQGVAARIGQPTAARAVARACASNRVAILIPCHRVVRTDGALGGYRWGVQRKQALLNAESGLR